VALSVITIGELQLGVLNAGDAATRARRADTLAQTKDSAAAVAPQFPVCKWTSLP
jgi:predicted nucleic acid-binding protein